MTLTPDELEELRHLWTDDARKLVPEFELLDDERMVDEIDRARRECGMRGSSDAEVIAFVIRNLDEDKGSVPGPWWWIAFALIIQPELCNNPWFEVCYWAFNAQRGKRTTNTFWGAASAGKSEFFVSLTLVNMALWLGDCYCYISSPWKSSGQDKIFRSLDRRVSMWELAPPQWSLDLGIKWRSVRDELTATSSLGEAMTSFISLETTASITGKKRSREEGVRYDARKGVILLIGDEILINPSACRKFLEGEGNLVSNSNFAGIVGANPLPELVRHANAIELSAPSEVSIESLNEHENFNWKTARGHLYRFAMAISPNRFREEPIFEFLIHQAQADAASKRGDANVAGMVASWGFGDGSGNGGVLNLEAINNPNNQAPPVWSAAPSRCLFADLAFGGNDPAGYCALEFGKALIDAKPIDVINGIEQGKLHVQRIWKPSQREIDEFTRLAEQRGGKAPHMVAGEEYGANHSMTFSLLRKANELGIPRGHVSWDSSLRPDITQMLIVALGSAPWYYSGTRPIKEEENGWPMWPPVAKPTGGMQVWSDCHVQPISAFWRFAEHLIARGHIHGLSRLRKGALELISRRWIQGSTGRTDVEGKKHLAVSPMYAETLALGLAFAVRFLGALPQLRNDKVLVNGVAAGFADHDIFKLKPRKLARIW